MLILACDTTGDLCSVAVADDHGVRCEVSFRHERRLTERLPGIVAFALSETRVALAEIDAYAAGIGPGSFTGVRVGVTVAKTWAWASDKPAVGIPSLEAVVADFADPTGVVAVAPCRRGEVIAWFGGDDYRQVRTDAVVETARAALGCARLVITGESAAWVDPSPDVEIVPRAPSAGTVARLAAVRLGAGAPGDPIELAPLYVAPPPIRGGMR